MLTGCLLVPDVLAPYLDWAKPLAASRYGVTLAAAHTVAVFVALLMVGALAPLHMRVWLMRKKRLASGLSLLGVLLGLAVTGGGLHYLQGVGWATWAALPHLTLATLAVAVAALHMISSRRPVSSPLAIGEESVRSSSDLP